MVATRLQTRIETQGSTFLQSLIIWTAGQLENERERLALWMPVLLGMGICTFFSVPTQAGWLGSICMFFSMATIGILLRRQRLGKAFYVGSLALLLGLMLIWGRANWISAPVLANPVVTEFSAQVEAVQFLSARGKTRLLVRPIERPDLPPLIRLTANQAVLGTIAEGEYVGLRARLAPPPPPNLPGGYDFARRAWFEGVGAVGSILGSVERQPEKRGGGNGAIRTRLTQHIHRQIDGSAGGIAAALVTGDRGAIDEDVEEDMRRSGLAHLLSISGLHVTAVIGFSMLSAFKIFGLSPRFALSGAVLSTAAAVAALVGGAYTLLAGAEVPTLRSFIAALLVLTAILIGRESITLRLVGAGAAIILLWRPEALMGASFQLSFAAVTTIVVLHETRWVKNFLTTRDERMTAKVLRNLAGLLLTGLAVEVALMPIALLHFHKAGIYGAAANMIAIPLTTFIIMPAEALALAFDLVGAGRPFWWIAEWNLKFMVELADMVANAPGAVRTLPDMPHVAFALMALGGLWFLIWQQTWRIWGLVGVAAGVLVYWVHPAPNLIVSRDGKQVAARVEGDRFALLRLSKNGFSRDMMMEAGGSDLEPMAIRDWDQAECNADFCRWVQTGEEGRSFTILATRSRYYSDYRPLIAACNHADIVISDRNMPKACRPKYLLLDRGQLERAGGVVLSLGREPPLLKTSAADSEHPWKKAQLVSGYDEINDSGAKGPTAFLGR